MEIVSLCANITQQTRVYYRHIFRNNQLFAVILPQNCARVLSLKQIAVQEGKNLYCYCGLLHGINWDMLPVFKKKHYKLTFISSEK